MTPKAASGAADQSACVTLVACVVAGVPDGVKDLDFAVELLTLPKQN
ncbi:hypothetical protein [Caballeronia calidae]|jgi:hypothetical protein|nr:hypothetical protein [Caballeronia calidae]